MIYIPQKGDIINVSLNNSAVSDTCQVVQWNVEEAGQKWAVLHKDGRQYQVNLNQIAIYGRTEKDLPKKYAITSPDGQVRKVAAQSPTVAPQHVIKKTVAADPDPTPELHGITDPKLRARKLGELRLMQKQEKIKNIKDHMTNTELARTEHDYQMPGFKKRTGE